MLARIGRVGLAAVFLTTTLCAQSGLAGLAGRVHKRSSPLPPVVSIIEASVDAGAVQGSLSSLWRDHYDFSTSDSDDLQGHLLSLLRLNFIIAAVGLAPEIIHAEWGAGTRGVRSGP